MDTLIGVVLRNKGGVADGRRSILQTVAPETTVMEAVRKMSDANVGCVLVTDGGCVAGILTERDVLHGVAKQGMELAAMAVRDVMNPNPHLAHPELTVQEALAQCTDLRIRHLPVVDQNRLLGLLSIGDLVYHVVRDKQRKLNDMVEYMYGRQIRL
ncbi:MAG: CBS domain-containing protein [Chromatiales bacterium]|nr:CBS domain-containing protein [Chromatiales bacterium]